MFSLTHPGKPFLPVLMLAALVAAPAIAAEKAPAPAKVKGSFDVGMIKDEKGVFAYCLMRGAYSNGLQLAIALSPRNEVNVGVVVPEGGFTKDDKYPIRVKVDGIFDASHVGMAPQPELLMVPLGADAKALSALKKGKVLSLEGPEDIAYFSLKGTGRGLADLERCVGVGTGKIKPPAPAASAPSESAKAGKASFPAKLAQLLKGAGLSDLQPLPVPDPSKAPVDFAWRTNGIIGGLRERPVPDDMTLEKMTTIIESGYKKQCKGMFNSTIGDLENHPGVTLRSMDVSCQSDGKYAYVAMLVYLTDTHLFSMFMHEAEGAEKEKATSARDKIAASIRDLAKKQGAAKSPPKTEAPAAAPAASSPASGTPPTESRPETKPEDKSNAPLATVPDAKTAPSAAK